LVIIIAMLTITIDLNFDQTESLGELTAIGQNGLVNLRVVTASIADRRISTASDFAWQRYLE
jgi:hypothetical protein